MRKSILLWFVLIPFISLAQYQQLGQTLEGTGLNEGHTSDLYGYKVALSGDGMTVAVSAIAPEIWDGWSYPPFYNSKSYVQVFRMVNEEWQQLGDDFLATPWNQGDGYSQPGTGLALSEDGNTLVINEAMYRETLSDGTNINGSRVRVFNYANGSWNQIGDPIYNTRSQASNNGNAFAVDINDAGDIIAIGHPYEPDGEGFVDIYQNVNDTWVQMGEDINGSFTYAYLGRAISLSGDGNRIAITEDGFPEWGRENKAKVKIYDFINNEWVFKDILSREYLEDELSFIDLSLSGNGKRLAIGNSGRPDYMWVPTPPESHYGHITIFEENEDNEWVQIHTIDGEYYEFLGYSVDMSWDGKTLASSPYIGFENKIFRETDGEWNLVESIMGGDGENVSNEQISLSRDGSFVAFGNYRAAPHGEAYVYMSCELSEINVLYDESYSLCNGSTALLTASIIPEIYAEAGTINWYDSEDGAVPVFVGGEFETPPLSESITYWVEAVTELGCASERHPVEVIVYNTPELELNNEEIGICEGNTAVFIVDSDADLVNWFDSEEGVDPIYTGLIFETPVLYENTSYWVEGVTGDICFSERVEVLVLVSEMPELTIENTDIEICEGAAAILTASVSIGNINWYESEAAVDPVFTGVTFETPVLTETTSYWVEAVNEYCVSERIEITVTVNPLPELEIENTSVEVCLGSDAYLYAYSEGNVIFWYAEEEDTEYLYHGNNFIVPGLTEDTTFWVEAFNLSTGCFSGRIPVIVKVTPVSDLIAEETEFEICAGNSVTLTATSSSTVYWYDSADSTEPVFTGEEFTTPVLNATTHYWAEAFGEGECVSDRIEFTVNVNSAAPAPEAEPIQLYFEGMTLADFEVEFTGIITWYADEDLTVELPNTTLVVIQTIYYVTQTIGDCESEATEVMADETLNNQNLISNDFAYYPNPVKDRLYFRGSDKIRDVQIFDMSGRLILNQADKSFGISELDLGSLPEGTYIVRAQTDKELKTFKIIKSK